MSITELPAVSGGQTQLASDPASNDAPPAFVAGNPLAPDHGRCDIHTAPVGGDHLGSDQTGTDTQLALVAADLAGDQRRGDAQSLLVTRDLAPDQRSSDAQVRTVGASLRGDHAAHGTQDESVAANPLDSSDQELNDGHV